MSIHPDYPLTDARRRVLEEADAHLRRGAAPTTRALARALGVNGSTVGGHLQQLEWGGYITGRGPAMKITDDARRMLAA